MFSGTHVVEVCSVFAVELVEGQLVIVLQKHTGQKATSGVCVCVCVQSDIYCMVCADLCKITTRRKKKGSSTKKSSVNKGNKIQN